MHSNLSEITISEPTQRHDNYAEQLVTDSNGVDGWCEVEERTSGVTDTLFQEPDMTENVEKITFAPGEGNKPLGIIMDKLKTLNCCHFPLLTISFLSRKITSVK